MTCTELPVPKKTFSVHWKSCLRQVRQSTLGLVKFEDGQEEATEDVWKLPLERR